eukprot:Gb_20822 [translate_table: standard]
MEDPQNKWHTLGSANLAVGQVPKRGNGLCSILTGLNPSSRYPQHTHYNYPHSYRDQISLGSCMRRYPHRNHRDPESVTGSGSPQNLQS